MKNFNANQYPDVYAAMGISIPALGCIMLDTDSFPVTELVDQGKQDLYESQNPDRFWIAGAVAEFKAHVTLLYGLMAPGPDWKGYVDRVLDGWTPPSLEIESIGSFPSPYADEPYSCIIAHIKVTDELLEGHARLQLLPHIDTYGEYKPHLTLAYVKKEAEQKWLDALAPLANKATLTVNTLNYGGSR